MNTRKADRKGKKGTRKPTEWTKLVTAVYKELKAKNPNAKLGDAMKEAAKRRKGKAKKN